MGFLVHFLVYVSYFFVGVGLVYFVVGFGHGEGSCFCCCVVGVDCYTDLLFPLV